MELSQQRRAAVQEKAHLLFLYSSALYHAQEILMKSQFLEGFLGFVNILIGLSFIISK